LAQLPLFFHRSARWATENRIAW